MFDLNDVGAEQGPVDDEVLGGIVSNSLYLFPLKAVEAGIFDFFSTSHRVPLPARKGEW